MNPYEELDVPKDADEATIAAAFKRKAMSTHPDRASGNAEAFKRVNSAYQLLCEPKRRAQYDATGNADPQAVDEEAFCRNALTTLFFAFADQRPDCDIIGAIHDHLRGEIKKLEAERKELGKKLHAREKVLKRLSRREGAKGFDFLRVAIENDIAKLTHLRDVEVPRGIERAQAVMNLAGSWRYEVPRPDPLSQGVPAGYGEEARIFGHFFNDPRM